MTRLISNPEPIHSRYNDRTKQIIPKVFEDIFAYFFKPPWLIGSKGERGGTYPRENMYRNSHGLHINSKGINY